MEDLCTGCLCSGRKLVFVGDTGFYQLYSQIINEIPMHTTAELCVRLCWECCALLRKFQKFKAQVKKNYTDLLWNIPSPSMPAHLTTNEVHNISYPEELAPCIKGSQVKDELIIEDIKTEDDDVEHQEPEAFVNNLSIEKEDDKPTKKSKKKPKEKKPSKNKINVKKKRKFKTPKNQSTITIPPLPELNQSDGVSDTEIGMLLEDDFEEVENGTEEKVKEDVTLKNLEMKTSEAVESSHTESVKANGHLPPARVPKPTAEPLPDKPQCAECGKTFSSRKTYRYHLNVLHKGNNRYPCPRCGKIYQWKSNLGRHMRSHKAVDADELYCELCEKRFASVATYRQHLRISRMHVTENEFNYTCNECGKKFVNKTRLRDHIDWEHLKKIKFRCQLCNKPFKCHTSLYVHLQNVHRNKEKKDNLCHVCGKSYQNAAKLKYHITALHTGETPYRCSQCAAAFGWYSSLYRHVREVHYKVKSQPKKSKKSKKLEIDPPGYMNYQPV